MPTTRRTVLTGSVLLGSAALAASCAPTRALNFLAAVGDHHAGEGLAYGELSRQRFDLYRPKPDVRNRAPPLVVFFYGGSWNSGERADYRFVGEALAARGSVVMVADYRLHPEVTYPAFLRDCARAVAFALEHARDFGADPARVFVMGHSAGAYNAAMIALDPRWLHAGGAHAPSELAGWIGLAGPYDFLPIQNPQVKPVFGHPDVPPESQPVVYARRRAVPTFLGAAAKDTLVDPTRNTRRLAEMLRGAGTPVALHLYERVSHITLIGALAWPLRFLAPVLDDLTAFIDRH